MSDYCELCEEPVHVPNLFSNMPQAKGWNVLCYFCVVSPARRAVPDQHALTDEQLEKIAEESRMERLVAVLKGDPLPILKQPPGAVSTSWALSNIQVSPDSGPDRNIVTGRFPRYYDAQGEEVFW